jgi:hypothetical protein
VTLRKERRSYLFGGEYYDGIENVVLDHLFKYDLAKQEWKCLCPGSITTGTLCYIPQSITITHSTYSVENSRRPTIITITETFGVRHSTTNVGD